MQYIIENAECVLDGEAKHVCIHVNRNEIRYIGSCAPKLSIMKMNTSSFHITPSFVVYAPDLPFVAFEQFKFMFTNEFLLKGVGTVITNFDIRHEHEFDKKLLEKRTSMLNSPIDFILGIKVPPSIVGPSLIRKCKSAKIPVILIEFSSSKELDDIPWGWIREASFPYNPVFIPTYPSTKKPIGQLSNTRKWSQILLREKIAHLPKPMPEHKPLNIQTLKTLGIYPKRGILKVGGEISYNLFLKNTKFEDYQGLDYDHLKPAVAVQKGEFVSVNQKPIFRPGSGTELNIQKTALFV